MAKEHDRLDAIRDQLGQLADAVAEDRGLQVFFFSPYLSSDDKKEGLHKAVEGADETLLNFVELLSEKHRMLAIFRIRVRYDVMWERENRRRVVGVTSAIEMDGSTVSRGGDDIVA